MRRAWIRAASAVCCAWLAGCATVPTESFHTLSVTAQQERQGAAGVEPELSIAIDRIALPDIVDRPQFVLRVDPNRVRILEQQRWAESLRVAIPRVIAGNIARILGTARVGAYPGDPPADVRYRIALDITQFEAQSGAGVTVEATWIVRAVEGGARRSGHTMAQEPAAGPDYETLALAHSRALGTISRDIAQAIAALARAQ
ncbi:MAG: PqiC family protein [Betaproteobacteria bacterium]